MQSLYRAMGKSNMLRLICFALILFVFPVAGGIRSTQPVNPQKTTPVSTLSSPKRPSYTFERDSREALWAQGARRICL